MNRNAPFISRLWFRLAAILAFLSITPILGAGFWALQSIEETLQQNERQQLRTLDEIGAATVQQYLRQGNEKLVTVAALLAKELEDRSEDDQQIVLRRLNGLVAPPDIYLELQYYAIEGPKPRFVGAAKQPNIEPEDQEARIEANERNGPLVYEPFLNNNSYNAPSPVMLRNNNLDPDVEALPLITPEIAPDANNNEVTPPPKTQPTSIATTPIKPKKKKRPAQPEKKVVPTTIPQIAPASASSGLGLSVPVAVNGKRLGVLVAYLDLSRLSGLLESLSTGGSEVLLFDGDQNLLARAGAIISEKFISERGVTGYSDWVLEVRAPSARLHMALAALQQQSYLWLSFALLLATLVSLGLAAWITRPITALTRTAEAMTAGDLKARTNILRNDEIGRLAFEFDRMANAVERLDTAKSDFVANVSHELRTPLTSMKLSIANLLDGVVGEITPKQETTLTRLRNDVSRLIELVNTLLDLARLEASASQPKKQRVSLLLLAKEAASTLEPLAQQRSIRFEWHGNMEALVDTTMMVRVFFNLFDNAIKFIPAGGFVEVTFTENKIKISDSGPGIEIPDPFAKFSQGASRGVKHKGAGLGLALVKKMVELQGGTIRLEPGPGACLVIEL
jgi:two-component system, OmpR family, sensor histidine kinase BaeS